MGMFDNNIRLGLRYSKYHVLTDFEKFKFQQGGIFIQF